MDAGKSTDPVWLSGAKEPRLCTGVSGQENAARVDFFPGGRFPREGCVGQHGWVGSAELSKTGIPVYGLLGCQRLI